MITGMKPGHTRNPPRLVLGPEEQRTLLETVTAIGETVRALKGTDDAPGFAGTLRILFEIRLDAMTRTGRHKTMVRLLEQVLQDNRAARIEEEVYERTRS